MKFLKKNSRNNSGGKSFLKNASLTFKLTLGITLLIAFIMGTVGFATFKRDKNILIEETYSKGWSIINTVQSLAAAPVQEGNSEVLNNLVSRLADDNFINKAVIVDNSGKIIAHNNSQKTGSKVTNSDMEKAVSSGEKYTGSINGEGSSNAVSFAAPIRDSENNIQGHVYLAANLAPMQEHLQDTIRHILWMFVLASIAAMLLTRLIIRRSVLHPVQSLVKANEKIASGDFSQKVDINTRDELGYLGRSFNLMTEQLAVLFQSIHSSVSDISKTASSIAKRTDSLKDEQNSDNQEVTNMAKEINSAARHLNRISNKLSSLALQYKTDSTNPGEFW